jgi:hypothetical protein
LISRFISGHLSSAVQNYWEQVRKRDRESGENEIETKRFIASVVAAFVESRLEEPPLNDELYTVRVESLKYYR